MKLNEFRAIAGRTRTRVCAYVRTPIGGENIAANVCAFVYAAKHTHTQTYSHMLDDRRTHPTHAHTTNPQNRTHTHARTAVASNSRFTVLIKSDDGFYARASVRASTCVCVFVCGSVGAGGGVVWLCWSFNERMVYLNSFKL